MGPFDKTTNFLIFWEIGVWMGGRAAVGSGCDSRLAAPLPPHTHPPDPPQTSISQEIRKLGFLSKGLIGIQENLILKRRHKLGY